MLDGKISYGTVVDKPTHDDLFNINKYIDGLTQFILNCDTPMTVAIQGDWGTGKTSIMQQVSKKLGSAVTKVDFNTWQYSQFNMGENLSFSLISELLSSLPIKKEGEAFRKAKDVLKVLTKNLATSAIKIVGVDGKEIVDSLANSLSEDERLVSLKEFKNKFQEVVNQVKNEKNVDRIVIFIDDLDRLVPARAVELLEVLKLFLDCEGCVFVLAIDYNVVVRGVRNKYGNDLDAEKGNAFFEKIIQVPFTVPVENYDMSEFIKSSLESMRVLKLKEDEIEDVVKLIACSIGSNPRSLKRLFNSYSLLLYITAADDWKNQDKILLLALLCLQKSYQPLYLYLVQQDKSELKEALKTVNNILTADKLDEELDLGDDFELTSEFKEFITIFLELTEGDLNSVYDKLKVSNTVASGNQDVKTKGDKSDFWSEFDTFLQQKNLGRDYELPDKTPQSDYRITSKSTGRKTEFQIKSGSANVLYFNKLKKNLYNLMTANEEKFKMELGEGIRFREENAQLPALVVTNKKLSLKSDNFYEVFEWYFSTLKKIEEIIKIAEE